MEVYFNELSLSEKTRFQYEDVERIRDLIHCLRETGIKTCRIDHDSYTSVAQKIREMKGFRAEILCYLLSYFQSPFESSDVDTQQDEYYRFNWRCGKVECIGFALAIIMESMAFSICDVCWDKAYVIISRDADILEARNLFGRETLFTHREWLEDKKPLSLQKCEILPESKSIDLRNDHGIDELKAFSKRIVQSEYVCEVINSLRYHSNDRRFIHKIYGDGRIEIVLPWTDRGLGLVVRTTGRNYRETEAIGRILFEKYGYR